MKQRTIAVSGLALGILISLMLFGCGGPYARVTLQSMPYLNPDDGGAPLPVVVRIYQLKSSERLENADFLTLYQGDAKLLGDHLLDREETTIYPNADHFIEVTRKEGARFLGVAAFFRRPSGMSWRQVIPLTKKRQKVFIILEGQTVSLSKKKRKRSP